MPTDLEISYVPATRTVIATLAAEGMPPESLACTLAQFRAFVASRDRIASVFGEGHADRLQAGLRAALDQVESLDREHHGPPRPTH